ncbi:unnamed protein product [Adineta ricciae]|uniref:Uncharacterized protein n=1 Tax=Adineta ricciae TaxID=249248 RepID=A0A816EEG8_ADIRI|nr:unnamed protein product [Adineta ricciae]CAF1644957.1 unnamed protein product [Adineta ricciae]
MINSNSSISALNYYQNNQICQLFSSRITSIYVQLTLHATLLYLNQSNLTVQIGQYFYKQFHFVYLFALFILARTTVRPPICPSAVWKPNATTVVGPQFSYGTYSDTQHRHCPTA